MILERDNFRTVRATAAQSTCRKPTENTVNCLENAWAGPIWQPQRGP